MVTIPYPGLLSGFPDSGFRQALSLGARSQAMWDGLEFSAGLCRRAELLSLDHGIRWSRTLKGRFISEHWYGRVVRMVRGDSGLRSINCHGQSFLVMDNEYAVKVKLLPRNSRLSRRNRTDHSDALLQQRLPVDGVGPLDFWELGYRLTPAGSLYDVRFQFRFDSRILDTVWVSPSGIPQGLPRSPFDSSVYP